MDFDTPFHYYYSFAVDEEILYRPASVEFIPWDQADDLFQYYNDRMDEESGSDSDKGVIASSDEEDEHMHETHEHENRDDSSIDSTDSLQLPNVDYRHQDLEPS